MTRYYFHLIQDDLTVHDPDGVEFESDASAIADGERAAREILAERLWANKPVGEDVFLVVRETGETVGSIRMKSMVQN
jgi:hypothetical protein